MRRKIPPPRINNIKKTVPLCNNFPASPVYLIESAFKNKFSYEQKQNKTMKKFVFTLLLVFVCHLGYAQSINGLFNEFGSEKNADCVKVSSFMMSLGKMFAESTGPGILYGKRKRTVQQKSEQTESERI